MARHPELHLVYRIAVDIKRPRHVRTAAVKLLLADEHYAVTEEIRHVFGTRINAVSDDGRPVTIAIDDRRVV